MSPTVVGIIGLAVFFIILAFGMPIGVAMAMVGVAGIWYLVSASAAISKMAFIPFLMVADYSFAVLPLFILMANVIFASGLGSDLYDLAAKWLGRQRGGLAMATVGGCAGFAAMSASSLATAVTMGLVAYPEMKRYNYSPTLITGCIAAGGTIGILIPPSSLLIIYGIITALTLVGIIIAWLPIWMGVLLFQAGSRAESAAVTKQPVELVTMMDKLKVYFIIQGVLAIIGLVSVVIMLLGLLATGGALFEMMDGF